MLTTSQQFGALWLAHGEGSDLDVNDPDVKLMQHDVDELRKLNPSDQKHAVDMWRLDNNSRTKTTPVYLATAQRIVNRVWLGVDKGTAIDDATRANQSLKPLEMMDAGGVAEYMLGITKPD